MEAIQLAGAIDRIRELENEIETVNEQIQGMENIVTDMNEELEEKLREKRQRLDDLHISFQDKQRDIELNVNLARQDLLRAQFNLIQSFEAEQLKIVSGAATELEETLKEIVQKELLRRTESLNEEFRLRLKGMGEEIERSTANLLSQKIATIKRQIEEVKEEI